MKFVSQLVALDRANAQRHPKPAAQREPRRLPVRLPEPTTRLVERILAARVLQKHD